MSCSSFPAQLHVKPSTASCLSAGQKGRAWGSQEEAGWGGAVPRAPSATGRDAACCHSPHTLECSRELLCPRLRKRGGCNQHTYKGRSERTCCWSLIETNVVVPRVRADLAEQFFVSEGILSLKWTKQKLKSQRI